MNTEEINAIDLSPYKAQINGYKLRIELVINETYSVEDVLIVGLRALDREKKWQEKFGTTSQKAKMEALKAEIKRLGGNPEDIEILQK